MKKSGVSIIGIITEEGNHSVTKLTHKVDGDHALLMSPQYQM